VLLSLANIMCGCGLVAIALMQLQGLQLLERCISGFVRPGRDVEGDWPAVAAGMVRAPQDGGWISCFPSPCLS
jgi:hypothetical protein